MLLLAAALVALPAPDCRYDRAAMLALDYDAFDQDMAGGWRGLSNRGCTAEAANLIRDWRTAHGSDAPDVRLLFWHEGQMRVEIGQKQQAIALFERSRKPAEIDRGWGWNLYVDGTIAFLRGDRSGLERARAALAALPRPPELAQTVGPDGKPIKLQWPRNLNMLDGFRRCWNQPYRQALACAVPTSVKKG